jgi:DNA-binding XRE family transcriptional regulator
MGMESRDIAKRLIFLRESCGLSQKQAADKIGLSVSAIQKYEYGQHPSRRNLERIVSAYGCDKTWLLTGAGTPFPGEIEPVEVLPVRIVPAIVPKKDAPANKTELLKKTAVVLDSETTYREVLSHNIEAFHSAVVDTQSLEGRMAALEEKLERLAKAAEDRDAQDHCEKGGTGI